MNTLIAQVMKADANTLIAATALFVSLCSLMISVYFWMRASRPIVTAAVKTHPGQQKGPIFYDLVVQNSGSIPAKDVRITVEEIKLTAAFGKGATEKLKPDIYAVFATTLLILQNGDKVVWGPFAYTDGIDTGFWKYNTSIPIVIRYKGWFGRLPYKEEQRIQIVSSESVTGYLWGTYAT